MANYVMTHNLQKCVGCGACMMACKNENNVQEGMYWLNYMTRTTGRFPDVKFEFMLLQCNHCENAPCAKACPTAAMHKDENGLTLHEHKKCIGCKTCMQACPYNAISYNKSAPHARWRDDSSVSVMTSSGKETAGKLGVPVAYYNPDRENTYPGVRYKGIVEKCTLCDHRLEHGEQPYCVTSCPAQARLVGDLDNPEDPVHNLIGKYGVSVLKPERGTKPKVYYLREY